MVFYGNTFAGSIIGFEIGLSAAEMFNPLEENESNVIGEAIYLLLCRYSFL
jgi:flagellar biosynthesis protein FliR